jgi:hypothetical protein
MTTNLEKYKIKLQQTLDEILAIVIKEAVLAKVKGFQIPHIQNIIYALKKFGTALDASDTGTGKTYGSIGVCLQEDIAPFIVCPKAVVPTWFRVCEMFGVKPLGIANYETLKNGNFYETLGEFESEVSSICPFVDVIKVDSLDKDLKPIRTPTGKVKKVISEVKWLMPKKSLIIFDEGHKGKNGTGNKTSTGNSRLMVSVREYISLADKKWGLFLSATITDKLENFAVMGYLLGFYKPYNSKAFKQFLFNLSKDQAIAMKKIHRALFPFRGARMRIQVIKNDTGSAIFKENSVKAKVYPVSAKIAKAIEGEHAKIRRSMEELRSYGESKGLGYIIRCWQKIEVLKVPTVVELIIKHLQKGRSVVVFINYTETKKLIFDRMIKMDIGLTDDDESYFDPDAPPAEPEVGPLITQSQVGFIDGQQGAVERDNVVEGFREDKIHLVICQIKAGGVGLSLHDIRGERPRVSLVFPSWSAIDMKQALGRIYRADAKTNAKQRIIYCSTGKRPKKIIRSNGTEEKPVVKEIEEFENLFTAGRSKDDPIEVDTFITPDEISKIESGEIEIEEMNMDSELSIEEMLCETVDAKLKNIELLNEGKITREVDLRLKD